MASIFKRTSGGPWAIEYRDAQGRRRRKSSGTTDKRAAERIAAKLEADVALRRLGVIDARLERIAGEGHRPLREHISEYIAHCRRAEQAPRHVLQKERHLLAVVDRTGIGRLGELTAEALERDLQGLRDEGASARTVNFRRQIVVAFVNWCVRTNRADSNPLRSVPRLDETADKRRVRRALTPEEASRLLAAAEKVGRKAWYLAALLGGLRKGELQRLTWGDVDLETRALTVRNRKGKREDQIAIHPMLAEELKMIRPEDPPSASPVFATTVTDRTREQDFLRAKIKLKDEAGRVVDLHSLRTTLGTYLERAGASLPQAQRVLRHKDARTTQRYYTRPELVDTATTLQKLAPLQSSELCQRICQQTAHDSVPNSATSCDGEGGAGVPSRDRKPLKPA